MKKVVLAGVCLKEEKREFAYKMQECKELCKACGMEVVAEVIQNSNTIDQRTCFRSGKLEELAMEVTETDARLVVFYNPLRVQMAERIAAVVGCNVIDRTALILDIFSSRARTRQSKIQTEMARLSYDLPRVLQESGDSERSRGGAVNNRGSGEMRSAIIARKYKGRITELKKELSMIEARRSQDERRRNKTKLRRAALVGYTNAGKSSFMNAVLNRSNHNAGTDVYAEDVLFATLDTSVRMIDYQSSRFLLYDTVGFVSDLPSQLLDAFHSTLSAAKDADVLVQIVDVSDPLYREKIAITQQTLEQIGAQDVPILRIYNKIDLCDEKMLPDGICISCQTNEGIDKALDAVLKLLYPEEECVRVLLPYDKIAMFDEYKPVLRISVMEQNEDGMSLELKGPKRYTDAFRAYTIHNTGGNNEKDSLGKTQC